MVPSFHFYSLYWLFYLVKKWRPPSGHTYLDDHMILREHTVIQIFVSTRPWELKRSSISSMYTSDNMRSPWLSTTAKLSSASLPIYRSVYIFCLCSLLKPHYMSKKDLKLNLHMGKETIVKRCQQHLKSKE